MVSYRMVKREWERLAPAISEAGLAWQNGARLPESWMTSQLVWIPKEEAAALTVDKFRPLSLEQSCSKMLYRMVAEAWMPYLGSI
eukprot:816945-Amphidinium_carterae.1